MIYEPEEDSYLIKKYIKGYIKNKQTKVLDMGTGSCILAEEAQKYSGNVLAVDINPEVKEIAKKKHINFIESNLFENKKLKTEKFDLILFNPPYLPELENEPEELATITTGGKEGHELLEQFLQQVKVHLNKSAKILLICSSLTKNGEIEDLFKKYSFKFKLIDKEDAFFEKILLYELKEN